MFGRLGHIYYMHLAEAQAQRRRLSATTRPQETNLAVFFRPLLVIAISLAAAGVIAAIVG